MKNREILIPTSESPGVSVPRPLSHRRFAFFLPIIVVGGGGGRRRDSARGGGGGAARGVGGEDGAGGEEEVELGVPHLKEVLGVELDGLAAGLVEDALDEAPVLAEHLEREAAAREVVEDARVAARHVHPAAEDPEVDVHVVRGGVASASASAADANADSDADGLVPPAAVAAEDDGVGLHVVLEVLPLKLGEPHLQVRRRRRRRRRGGRGGGAAGVAHGVGGKGGLVGGGPMGLDRFDCFARAIWFWSGTSKSVSSVGKGVEYGRGKVKNIAMTRKSIRIIIIRV